MKNTRFIEEKNDYTGKTQYRFSATLNRFVDAEPRTNCNDVPFRGVHLTFSTPSGKEYTDAYGIIYENSLKWAEARDQPVKPGGHYMCTAVPLDDGTTLLKLAPYSLGQQGLSFDIFSGEISVEASAEGEVKEAVPAFDDEDDF